MRKRFGLLSLCWLAALCATGQSAENLRHVSVTRPDGSVTTVQLSEDKPFVVFVLGTDCPISQKYIPTIKALYQSLGERVDFIGLFPGYFTIEEVAAFTKEYGLGFNCYVDHDMKAIAGIQATVTPEAFLCTPDLRCRYSGAIDNWFYSLGRYRTNPTDHYLKDAIESVLAGIPVKTTATEAVGCVIQQIRPSDGHSHNH